MRGATRGDMRETDQWRLYEYICEHFLASISADCRYLVHSMRFEVGAERFSYSTRTLIDAGYTAVMSWQAVDKTGTGAVLAESLQTMRRGDRLRLVDARLDERQTQPPDYLTEAELITLMEKHGIGTDASIPTHIENICTRNYVTVGDGRKLKPTPLGNTPSHVQHSFLLYSSIVHSLDRMLVYTLCVRFGCGDVRVGVSLVHGYHRIDFELVLPSMRSAVEKQLSLISLKRAKFEDVLRHALVIFGLKFRHALSIR